MSEQVGLYPRIISEQETDKIIQDRINRELNQQRIKEMMNKKLELERQLKHYVKMKNRWGRVDVGIKITGIGLAAGGAVVGVVVGVVAPPLMISLLAPAAPIVVGSLTAVETLITGGLVIGLTSRKKSFYREKIRIIQSYIDKMYLFMQKAQQDGVITIEEIESFHKLMIEYDNAIRGIKTEEFEFEKFHKEIKKESDKLLKKDLIQLEKERQLNQYKSNLNAVSGTGTLRRTATAYGVE
jgi:hypothetical protein